MPINLFSAAADRTDSDDESLFTSKRARTDDGAKADDGSVAMAIIFLPRHFKAVSPKQHLHEYAHKIAHNMPTYELAACERANYYTGTCM